MKIANKLKRLAFATNLVGAVLLLNGCAFTKDYIAASYVPQSGVTKVPGAETVVVHVDVSDVRATKDKVSVKKNGYGMEMAPIIATNDIAVLVKGALETELTDRGFQLGGGNVTVSAQVSKFYSDFKTGFWSGSAVAEATLEIQVRKADGGIEFSRVVSGVGTNANLQLASGSNAKIALDQALKDAMSKLFEDRQFADALLRSGRQPVAARNSKEGS